MRKRIACGVLALAVLQVAGAQSYQPGELLIKYRGVNSLRASSVSALAGARLQSENSSLGVGRVELPPNVSVEQAIAFYRRQPGVEFVEPNFVARSLAVPNDPMMGQQYGLTKMNCAAAWDLTTGDPGVVIAIVDTGIQLNHPDLAAKIVPGYDFVNNDTSADDDQGHGTHCAGISAAITNNGVGIAGVGYNCKLMPVKVLDASGSGSYSDVADGITWAVDNGAKVVSLSLGGPSVSAALETAVNYAWSHGVVVVAAAGNDNVSDPMYPGWYANAIAVGSTDQNDQKSSFSNYGNWVDVAAPGTAIYSTYPGSSYQTMSGTSMATPGVAGLAGLLWSRMGSSGTNALVRSKIESTCDPVGSWVVNGRVNAGTAVANAGGGGPAGLSGLSLASNTVFGGSNVTGTISLSGQAPLGGYSVNLASSKTQAVVPASVVVPAGLSSATFQVTTSGVVTDMTAVITASKGSVLKTSNLLIRAPMVLSGFTLTRAQVRGLSTLGGKVTISNTAPAAGVTVTLVSNNAAAKMPLSVKIRAGQRTASFTIYTKRVLATTDVVLSASYSGVTKTSNLRITR
ncbi:MAG: S8 family peptidase [Fimbriimonadaceae bacterium]|nr:S8 family peptidase [Fimbriimonadaceae bacterium]